MKKSMFLLLSMVLIFSLIVGCGGNNSENTSNSQDKPADTSANQGSNGSREVNKEEKETSPFLASKDPLELTIHMHYADQFVFDNEWPVFKEAGKLTNVSLRGVASSAASKSDEVFNIMMASGELPDIVHGKGIDLNKYGNEGAFLPLNDLIKEHAPNLHKFLEENDDVRRYITASDGNIYHISFIPDGAAAHGWFIRTDWLKQLNLEVPKTWEQYRDALKAFRDSDFDGNGKKDTVPFFSRSTQAAYDFLVFWDAEKDFFIEDNKVKYGPYEPEFPKGMKNVAEWYKEGIIDQEIFTRGPKSRDILLNDNLGGATHDWFGSTSSYNNSLPDKIPGFEFMPIAPPANIHGEHVESTIRERYSNWGWGISHTNEHPVETIKYFDFWFTEEGRRLANFGIEGVTYTMVDGKPIFTKEVLESGDVPNYLRKYGAQADIGVQQDFEYEKQWMNPIAKAGAEEYIENGYPKSKGPVLKFTTEEEKRLSELMPSIRTYVQETMQKWTMGAEDVTTGFDSFKNRLTDMGIEEALKIQQDALDRALKQ